MDLVIGLIVHGTPDGQKIYVADRRSWAENYIKTFYSTHPSKSSLEYMKVEKGAGRDAVCYTFIKSGDIQDIRGRDGGYVGITLVINNAYYTDIRNIYNLLQKSYEKFFINNILNKNGNYWKFSRSNLSDFSELLGRLYRQIINYIQQFSQDDDFVQIPTTFTSGSFREINLSECNPNAAMDAFRHDGGFLVSPQFSSVAEETRKQKLVQQYECKLTQARNVENDLRSQVGNLNNENASKDAKIKDLTQEVHNFKQSEESSRKVENDLRSQVENLNNENASKDAKIKDLTQEVHNFKQSEESSRKNEERLRQIQKIIEGKTLGNDGEEQNSKKGPKLRRCVNRIIPIVVLVFLLINIWISYELFCTQVEVKKLLCSLSKKEIEPSPISYKDSIRIDLDGYKEGWLKGKQCKASIEPKDKGNTRILRKIKGEWKAEGLELVRGKNELKCELQPTTEGKGKVCFYLENGDSVVRDVTITH